MKNQKKYMSLIAIALPLVSLSGFAATCNNTQGTIPPGGAVAGNSCGHNSNYNGSTFCGGVAFSITGTDVYQVQLNNTQGLSFILTSSAFTPDIAILANSCADNATCIVEASNGSGTVTANVPDGSTGTFFIIITDSTGIGAQCGAYNLTVPVTPVTLQEFSVQ